jgi:hypothetical protein
MKTLFTTLLLSLACASLAQKELPSIDQVFKNTLANDYVYKALEEDYGIANPKECKFEKRMTIGGGDVIDSDWSTYRSGPALKEANRLFQKWPDDRAYTVFTVTTPKNKDGVSYVLPLTVEYSRYKDGAIVNDWEYYWWKFETPYKTIGKLNSEEFFKLTMDTLKNLNYSYNPGNYPECPKALLGFYKINSIYESSEEDEIEKYSNREYVTRKYYVTGDYIYMPGSDYDSVYAHYTNRTAILPAQFSRELDNGKPIADWVLSKFVAGWGLVAKEGIETKDYAIRPTIERFGWDYVYQKENAPIGKAYFSNLYKKIWETKINQSLTDFYNGNTNAINTFKMMVKDEETAKAFENIINEVKQKLCYLDKVKDDYVFKSDYVEDNYSKPEEGGIVRIYFEIRRKSCLSDPSLKAPYKESGMQKAIWKAGAKYYSSEKHELKVSVINNELKIHGVPKLKKEIPF